MACVSGTFYLKEFQDVHLIIQIFHHRNRSDPDPLLHMRNTLDPDRLDDTDPCGSGSATQHFGITNRVRLPL
jgi:hypothetical protein